MSVLLCITFCGSVVSASLVRFPFVALSIAFGTNTMGQWIHGSNTMHAVPNHLIRREIRKVWLRLALINDRKITCHQTGADLINVRVSGTMKFSCSRSRASLAVVCTTTQHQQRLGELLPRNWVYQPRPHNFTNLALTVIAQVERKRMLLFDYLKFQHFTT